jgi:putative chitinase
MPRKKANKIVVKKAVVSKKKTTKKPFKLNFSESYVSLILGAAVIVIVLIIGFAFSKSRVNNQDGKKETSSISTTIEQSPTGKEATPKTGSNVLPQKYTIKSGDDLWNISLKFYKSGYNWVDIAKANDLQDPSAINAGNVLTIPNVKPIVPETSISAAQGATQEQAITETSYNVAKGDDLWNIAVRAYGDGFRYPEIAKANNLTNPSLIFSGNVLQIPR